MGDDDDDAPDCSCSIDHGPPVSGCGLLAGLLAVLAVLAVRRRAT